MSEPGCAISKSEATWGTSDCQWYAAYTRSRHEKCAAQQIQAQSLDCFLPLYRATRHWQHRRAVFELPLFPGYLFVRMSRKDRIKVLTAPGVLYLVGINGIPAEIEDAQIEALRTVLASRRAFPTDYLRPGSRVLFSKGLFAGLEGTIIHSKGGVRLVVSVDAIMSSISIEVDCNEVELVCHRQAIPVPAGQEHCGCARMLGRT